MDTRFGKLNSASTGGHYLVDLMRVMFVYLTGRFGWIFIHTSTGWRQPVHVCLDPVFRKSKSIVSYLSLSGVSRTVSWSDDRQIALANAIFCSETCQVYKRSASLSLTVF